MDKESTPSSFRLSAMAIELINRLQASLGLNKTGIVETAIRELAVKYNLIPKPNEEMKHETWAN